MIYFDFLTGKLKFIEPVDLDSEIVENAVLDFGDRNIEGDVILDTGYRTAEASLIDLQYRT